MDLDCIKPLVDSSTFLHSTNCNKNLQRLEAVFIRMKPLTLNKISKSWEY